MSFYLGTFLIALSTLTLEVTLSRFFSVITWYHLAFFAISTAMLGMTAGALRIYLSPNESNKIDWADVLGKNCLYYSVVIPVMLVILCIVPLRLEFSFSNIGFFLIVTFTCSLPYYFSGIVLTIVLTKGHKPIGKLYACDLVGAASGCLLVLAALEVVDAPTLILTCGFLGALSGLVFTWPQKKLLFWKKNLISCFIFILLASFNHFLPVSIAPRYEKGVPSKRNNIEFEKWNSFSRVAVSKIFHNAPQYWGASPYAPRKNIFQRDMVIDGEAATVMRRFSDLEDIKHLAYDITNFGYYLRPKGGACIIGIGGGRDLQSAYLFGHKRILGIEVNPIFVDLLQGRYRNFAGLESHEAFELVVDEARSYLTQSKEKFQLIQMSMIDTWAATGAGAFTLTENALYTVEAWQVFLKSLAEDGLFTVSRWHSENNLGETGRVASLAVSTMLSLGFDNPSKHIAMVTSNNISTLLISKKPLSTWEIERLKMVANRLAYKIIILPGFQPHNNILRKIVSSKTYPNLVRSVQHEPLNFLPPTDETPYFFNMLKFGSLQWRYFNEGVVAKGNLTAILTLCILIFSLLMLTVITIIVPLMIKLIKSKNKGLDWKPLLNGGAYFALIGAGFMFIEIALIQRLSVFLGHPVYALGILLFSIILSTGLGSYLSELLPTNRLQWFPVFPLATSLLIVFMRFFLSYFMEENITNLMWFKILSSIFLIFPMGLLLGFFFPVGMRLARKISDSLPPWFWALNGIFGVLCSAVAVFISIIWGISVNFYLASICYFLIIIFSRQLISTGYGQR